MLLFDEDGCMLTDTALSISRWATGIGVGSDRLVVGDRVDLRQLAGFGRSPRRRAFQIRQLTGLCLVG